MSGSVKTLDPAFQGAGQRVGTEIWRIEDFQPVPLPKSDYGKFYSGDSYIILQTTSGKGGAYLYDIHFWLGKNTSQDEAGTAAIKTVELDVVLGGRAVQYREVQGHETDKFLSYFKPCIIPLEGGVASGFKKPEEEEFETKLYICKGKRVVRMKQVPFSRSSLNHDDVFILDTKDKIYQFNGANSNIQERAKALEVIQFLKEKYHEGTCDVAIVDDGNLQAESDSGSFWVLFGGFAPISKKVITEDDIVPEKTPPKLSSITDGQVSPVDGELSKSSLENNKCYLLDCGAEVFVWIGRVTQLEERKAAIQTAEEYLVSENRPKATRVTRVIQGYETHSFKSNFDSWPSGSAPAPEEGRGKVAALLKQQGAGVKGASKSAPVIEEVPPLLEEGGKLEVWRINGNAKTPVPKEDIGKFYSGDCYVVLYNYHSHERRDDYYLCWWIGKDSIEEDQITAARLASTMCNSLKGRPVLGRVFQGKEPPQFVAIFQPMLVLKGGLSTGYKNYKRKNSSGNGKYDGRDAVEAMAKEAKRNDLILRSSGTVNVDGSKNFASLFSRRGEKGVNQDCFIVWEEFGCQEDMTFCGIFDGHGPWGHFVSKKVRESIVSSLLCLWQESLAEASADPDLDKKAQRFNIWKESFLKACATVDQELEHHPKIDTFYSGTTALTIVRQGEVLFIANVGDSRAVLATTCDDGNLVPVQLTVDFKPNLPQETERILQCNGRVFCLDDESGVHRLWLPDESSLDWQCLEPRGLLRERFWSNFSA